MALTSTMRWFETERLTMEENPIGQALLSRETLSRAERLDSSDRVMLDMDSSEIPVHSEQEGSAYQEPFESATASNRWLRGLPGGEPALSGELRRSAVTGD